MIKINEPSVNTDFRNDLSKSIYAALETYSNVHRGSGHNSIVTTHLYEMARRIVIEYLGLSPNKYHAVFCSPLRAAQLIHKLKPASYQCLSSDEFGLALGIRVVVVEKNNLPNTIPLQTGGGTARLIAPDWVVWSKLPERYEAGTPAITNAIAFARALQICKIHGPDIFKTVDATNSTSGELHNTDKLLELSGIELLNRLRKELIGLGKFAPTVSGEKKFINFDNGASTQTFTPIFSSFINALYKRKTSSDRIINDVKGVCSDFLGAPQSDYNLIFTSNTTEAINIAVTNLKQSLDSDAETVVINSILEHNSNELPWRTIENCSLIRIPINSYGIFDLYELEKTLDSYNKKRMHGKKHVKIVALSGASNVLGTYNNLKEISKIVHQYGAILLVDAAQLAAHRKIEMSETGIDILAFAAHKAYAPFGSGLLVIKKSLISIDESELRNIKLSGEENIAGIAAMGKALTLLNRIGLDTIQKEESYLTARLVSGLKEIKNVKVYGNTEINSSDFQCRGGVATFEVRGTIAHTVARKLAEKGAIGVRAGCHCAHILIKHLLKVPVWAQRIQRLIVLALPKIELPGLVRASLGIANSESDISEFLNILKGIADKNTRQNSHVTDNDERISPKDFKIRMKAFINETVTRVYGV